MMGLGKIFHFRDRPIKQKLVMTTMITTGVALLLAGLGIVLADLVLFRGFLLRDLSSLARMLADNSTAALAFDDPDTAAQTLASLKARIHVETACIYRPDGGVLARYSRDTASACPAPDPRETIRDTAGGLSVSEPVMLDGRRMGTLVLFYDLREISERLELYGGTVFGVLISVSFIAFLLSSRLRSVIANPISRLVNATTAVSETGDYTIRAERLSGDELGVLVDRFNEMLSGIQSRDYDLKKALGEREAALREAEEERQRFHFMAESMPQKIFTAGPNGDSLYLNRLWMDFTGLSFEQLKGWGWVQFLHPDDLEESVRAWRHSIATGEPLQVTNRFRRADGAYRWHLNRARAMRNCQSSGSQARAWLNWR